MEMEEEVRKFLDDDIIRLNSSEYRYRQLLNDDLTFYHSQNYTDVFKIKDIKKLDKSFTAKQKRVLKLYIENDQNASTVADIMKYKKSQSVDRHIDLIKTKARKIIRKRLTSKKQTGIVNWK